MFVPQQYSRDMPSTGAYVIYYHTHFSVFHMPCFLGTYSGMSPQEKVSNVEIINALSGQYHEELSIDASPMQYT